MEYEELSRTLSTLSCKYTTTQFLSFTPAGGRDSTQWNRILGTRIYSSIGAEIRWQVPDYQWMWCFNFATNLIQLLSFTPAEGRDSSQCYRTQCNGKVVCMDLRHLFWPVIKINILFLKFSYHLVILFLKSPDHCVINLEGREYIKKTIIGKPRENIYVM